jgi:hypothetical protein
MDLCIGYLIVCKLFQAPRFILSGPPVRDFTGGADFSVDIAQPKRMRSPLKCALSTFSISSSEQDSYLRSGRW